MKTYTTYITPAGTHAYCIVKSNDMYIVHCTGLYRILAVFSFSIKNQLIKIFAFKFSVYYFYKIKKFANKNSIIFAKVSENDACEYLIKMPYSVKHKKFRTLTGLILLLIWGINWP